MYRIALCDNDPLFLRRVELAIVDYNRAHPNTTPYQVTKYTSPARLLLDIQSGELYDAFLLEVTLHEMNSIALAAKIREISPIAVILFLSARTEFRFVQESFKVQALRYPSKLSLDATLPEVLSATEKQLERLKPAFFHLSLLFRGHSHRLHGDFVPPKNQAHDCLLHRQQGRISPQTPAHQHLRAAQRPQIFLCRPEHDCEY